MEDLQDIIKQQKQTIFELTRIVEASYDGIFVTDPNGVTVRVNPAYEKITGLKKEELLGKNVLELVKQGLLSESGTHKAIKGKKPVTILQVIKGEKEILVTCTPVFDEQGNLFRVLTNARDITELSRLRRQLESAEQLTKRYQNELLAGQELAKEGIVAGSSAMSRVIETIKRVAPTDATILLLGESGVGKEVICNLLHHLSDRSKGPLIKVNCAALPETLLESELFGYESGAFTGAKAGGKPGIFEMAKGGTIFLDEIGDMPMNLQGKLLRVLEEYKVRRLGGTQQVRIDARIVAATNKNLKELAMKGSFREDLYYRLSVLPIYIPPLRERADDIGYLIANFIQTFNEKYGRQKTICPEAVELLTRYNWPGNVRELKNTIERMVLLSPEDEISVLDLPEDILKQHRALEVSNVKIEVHKCIPLREAKQEVERRLIEFAVENSSSLRQAARFLGIDHSTLIRKLKAL